MGKISFRLLLSRRGILALRTYSRRDFLRDPGSSYLSVTGIRHIIVAESTRVQPITRGVEEQGRSLMDEGELKRQVTTRWGIHTPTTHGSGRVSSPIRCFKHGITGCH